MNNSGWRLPSKEEINNAVYWIKKNRNANSAFPIGCFLVLFTGIVSFEIATYIYHPDAFRKGLPVMLFIVLLLIFTGWFGIYNMIMEIEKVRMVSRGDFQIVDARVQYSGKKRMAKYAYFNVVEASYHTGFGAKPTTFTVSRTIMKKTKEGDYGYVIRFPGGKSWNKKALLYIPKKAWK